MSTVAVSQSNSLPQISIEGFPDFQPHPLVRGGHAQTLAAYYSRGELVEKSSTVTHQVELVDGDVICLHDDVPPMWQKTGPTMLLVHGLGGCRMSPYLRRIAHKLNQIGVRTFRMELRGCGTGEGLASTPYNAALSQDVRDAAVSIEQIAPGSPLCIAGFSLGGNLVLKLVGENSHRVPGSIRSVVAVCPPIELTQSAARLQQFPSSLYSRFFAR